MGVATQPAHSHLPDRPKQALTKQQTTTSSRPSHSTTINSSAGISPLNRSLFCWTTLSVVWAGVRAVVPYMTGAVASLCPHVHEKVRPKRNPKNRKERRTKNEDEKKNRYCLGGIQCTRYVFGGIQCRRYYFGDIQRRRYLLGGTQCWRYLLGGIESWRYSFGRIESWRYFLAVSIVGGTFLAEEVTPKYGVIFSAVM